MWNIVTDNHFNHFDSTHCNVIFDLNVLFKLEEIIYKYISENTVVLNDILRHAEALIHFSTHLPTCFMRNNERIVLHYSAPKYIKSNAIFIKLKFSKKKQPLP